VSIPAVSAQPPGQLGALWDACTVPTGVVGSDDERGTPTISPTSTAARCALMVGRDDEPGARPRRRSRPGCRSRRSTCWRRATVVRTPAFRATKRRDYVGCRSTNGITHVRAVHVRCGQMYNRPRPTCAATARSNSIAAASRAWCVPRPGGGERARRPMPGHPRAGSNREQALLSGWHRRRPLYCDRARRGGCGVLNESGHGRCIPTASVLRRAGDRRARQRRYLGLITGLGNWIFRCADRDRGTGLPLIDNHLGGSPSAARSPVVTSSCWAPSASSAPVPTARGL
jgi:hypothetical protein